jgi:hypothetical protein
MVDRLEGSMLGVGITKEGVMFEIETPEILYGENLAAAIIDKDSFSDKDVDSLLAPALGIENKDELFAIQIQGVDRLIWLTVKGKK